MIIYHNIEVSNRELDSKLLCAIYSCQFGNSSFLSFVSEFKFAFNLNLLPAGFYHTKSIAPTKSQLNLFPNLKHRNFLISSIDEESGLLFTNYDSFAKRRFSDITLNLVDIVFTWGEIDYSYLTFNYPEFSSKFILSGSPRVDLWKKMFSPFYHPPTFKKYILVPSNFGVNHPLPFWQILSNLKDMGYPISNDYLNNFMAVKSQQLLLLSEFIKLVSSLSIAFPDFDIIVRPHPTEDPNAWKLYTYDLSNVYVDSSHTLSHWIHHASLVVHNGCTSAIESFYIGIPTISYLTNLNLDQLPIIPNSVGFQAHSLEDVLDIAKNVLYRDLPHESYTLSEISTRFYQNPYFSALTMSEVWHDKSSTDYICNFSPFKLFILRCFFVFYPLVAFIKRLLARRNPFVDPTLCKFPHQNGEYLNQKISSLCLLLNIPQVKLHILSSRCFVISPR